MQSIAELIVRATDLAEAEGRVLRAMTIRVVLGVAAISVAAVAITAGVALLLGAAYNATTDRAGPAVGAAVTGVLALAVGDALVWLGRRIGT